MDQMASSTTSSVVLPGGLPAILTWENLILLLSAYILYLVIKFVYTVFIFPFWVSPLRELPTPKGNHWYLGHVKQIYGAPWIPYRYHEFCRDVPDAPFVRFLKPSNSEGLLANNITAYREVLQTKNDAFRKPASSLKGAKPIIGAGLPFAHGNLHRQRRSVLNKPFAPPKVRACVPQVLAKSERLVSKLGSKQSPTGEVEVETEIWRATLDIAGMKALGVDLDNLESAETPLHDIFDKTMRPTIRDHLVLAMSMFTPVSRMLRLEANTDFLSKCSDARRIVWEHVRARRSSWQQKRGGDKKALEETHSLTPYGDDKALDHAENEDALQAMIEQPGMWEDSEIVEHIVNFLLLGHDTTACTLVWAVDVLSRHGQLQDRLRRELASVRTPESESAGREDVLAYWNQLDRLRFLDNFLREVLRVYCPVPWIPLEATRDVQVAGVHLPKGTNVNLCPAVMNLNPGVWGPDAEAFNPDRWDDLQGDAASAYAFASFHNGPRVCIGKALSMMEMKVVLAALVSRFRIESLDPLQRQPEFAPASFTLKPKERLCVRLTDL